MIKMNIPEQTKRNTLILTALVVIASWTIGYFFLNYQFKLSVNDRFESLYESTNELFKINTLHEQQNFTLQLEKIIALDGVSLAVSNNDTSKLDAIISPFYRDLKKTNPDIKILTFRSVDNITLYRAHKPLFYGDKLSKKRKLIIDTTSLKHSLTGFELGKLDMTFRITHPIFYEEKYVGNVEIGLDPIHFIKDLKNVFQIEMGVAIDNSLIKIMLRTNKVRINENYSFLRGSERLQVYFEENENKKSTSFENDDVFKIKMSIPLQNHLKETLGYIIIGYDTTNLVQNDKHFMYSLFLMIVLMILFLGLVLRQGFARMLNQFTNQIYTDHLTGLKNRIALNSELNSKNQHVVILSNIKDFSLLNELYGLEYGNEVLIKIAKEFESFANNHKFNIFRISSDEYVLAKEIKEFEEEICLEVVEELQARINSLEIWVEGIHDSISVEIYSGIASDHSHTLEDAQMALKMAKEKSLPYLVYTKNVDTKKRSEKIIQVKRTIRYALDHNNVVPYFQGITDRDGKIIKYESLARIVEFDDGKKNVLTPFAFLEIAIKSGLYIEIAKKMLKQSLLEFKNREEKISINLLPKDFFNTVLMEQLLELIRDFESPQQIVIEITEQEGVEDFERLIKVITMLRKLGVLIAIDDFGSGYANYTHILLLKPDYIKIDGSLIRNILSNRESQILVKNIVLFCQDLGITTVAEYVENEEIFNLLKEYGVDEYQGFYFSVPTDLINSY